MNPPCGHSEAVCVVGNFWICKTCEATPIVKIGDTAPKSAFLDMIDKHGPFTGFMPIQKQVPSPWYRTMSLQQSLELILKDYRKFKVDTKDDSYGSCMSFIDPRTGNRSEAYRHKLYGVVRFKPETEPSTLFTQLGYVAQEFVRQVDTISGHVADARGWDKYRLATLGPLPHVIENDGLVAQAVPDELSVDLEIRLRGFFAVVPV